MCCLLLRSDTKEPEAGNVSCWGPSAWEKRQNGGGSSKALASDGLTEVGLGRESSLMRRGWVSRPGTGAAASARASSSEKPLAGGSKRGADFQRATRSPKIGLTRLGSVREPVPSAKSTAMEPYLED